MASLDLLLQRLVEHQGGQGDEGKYDSQMQNNSHALHSNGQESGNSPM